MQHDSLYTFTKGCFGNSFTKIKQGTLKKAKFNFPIIVLSEKKFF